MLLRCVLVVVCACDGGVGTCEEVPEGTFSYAGEECDAHWICCRPTGPYSPDDCSVHITQDGRRFDVDDFDRPERGLQALREAICSGYVRDGYGD